jgi:hypothetical protein
VVRLGDVLDMLGIDPDEPADADDFGIVTALMCRRTVEAAERTRPVLARCTRPGRACGSSSREPDAARSFQGERDRRVNLLAADRPLPAVRHLDLVEVRASGDLLDTNGNLARRPDGDDLFAAALPDEYTPIRASDTCIRRLEPGSRGSSGLSA